MKPAAFEYHAPRSLADAIALRSELADDSAILAGGQSLVPMLNLRLARPPHVIDLRAIDELHALTVDDEHVRVGAMVTQRTVERSAAVASALPVLRDAVRLIGHPQTRSRGTIAGSVAHADPAAELPSTLLALDGVVEVAGAAGTRDVPASAFFAGFFSTAVASDELIVAVRFPRTGPTTGTAIEEVSRTRGDFAIVGATSIVVHHPDPRELHWRVALFGVGATPVLLRGHCGDDARALIASEVASMAVTEIDPGSDLHGTSEYRRFLVRGLVERTLQTAAEGAA